MSTFCKIRCKNRTKDSSIQEKTSEKLCLLPKKGVYIEIISNCNRAGDTEICTNEVGFTIIS